MCMKSVQVLYVHFMHVHGFRLRLESHKETLSVVEPENKRLKQDCQHLKKVCVSAMIRFFIHNHACIYILYISAVQ